jgi:MoxR-like ATPase
MQTALQSVTCDEKIIEYIISLVSVTRSGIQANNSEGREDILRYISFGASPRAGIALQKCARITAMLDGRSFVLPDDVKKMAHAVLRHRLVLSYEAAADGLTADDIITKILAFLPVP